MMVMKRSSDSEIHGKSKRSRSRIDLGDNGLRERISSPESARDSGSPVHRSSSLTRKTDDRTYKRTSNVNMRNENNYPFHQKRVDRDVDPHLRITNLSSHVGDPQMKDAIFHELKKFGEVSVNLFGRGNERYAVVYFRTVDDAKEAKRVLERRGRVLIYDRPVRIDYRIYPEKTSSRRSYSPVSMGENFHFSRRSSSPPRRTTQRANNPYFEFDRNRGEYDRRGRGGGDAFTPPQQEYIPPEEDPKATRTLFVGNLETSVSSQELRRAFEKFGVVLDVDIKRPARGQGNTYAFVKFADLDVAAKAKVEMQAEYIGRNRVKIGYGRSQQTTRLWVGGLGHWTSISELEREFDRFGAIRRTDYHKGDDHAYILYDSLDAASVAAREMRGFQMGDRRLRIDFADKDQGLKGYGPLYQVRRDPSPPRGRANDIDPIDSAYSSHLSERDYRDDHLFLDPKREPSPYRRTERRDGDDNYRNWKENDGFQPRNVDRSDDNLHSSKFGSDSWAHERNTHYVESEDWERRSQDKPPYRCRGPQTPPNDFYENSPGKIVNENRNHKQRGPYQTKGFRDEGIQIKPHKKARTHSPSPNHTSNAKRISPDVRRHSGSSSDSHFSHSRAGNISALEDDEKHKSSDEASVNKKGKKDKDGRTKEDKSSVDTAGSATTENLQNLAKRFAVAWKGALILKNSAFPVRMHLVGGNPEVADSLRNDGSSKNALRITQRLRLDQPKLEEVSRRINSAGASGYCLLLALPGAQNQVVDAKEGEDLQQRPLRNLMSYLKQKQAAGVINLPALQSTSGNAKDDVGVLHAFPPCQFSHDHLLRIAPHLPQEPSREDHLVVVVVRGSA
ncbi:RNA-binding protein 15-like [Actinia tenebrosa]|uniref:RNA-binding protein 15-like n=1 Tax=Actinia tenebrosa TaxID=6105 RepID=A0A6P8IV83_ACTTE|nr:RNA-binding protein 15-like [Actinia tenebrosa]